MTRYIYITVLIVIFILAGNLLIFSSLKNSPTTDESVHLFAGYTYLTKNDFRLDPEHPPFIKELAAFPLLFLDNIKYSLSQDWDKAGNFYYDSWLEARKLGENFLFGQGNDTTKIIFYARLPMVFLTLMLGLFVYFWSKKLFGIKAGLFAAFLILFMPIVLANGPLVNTDVPLSLFFAVTLYFWLEFLESTKNKFSWKNIILFGLFLGLTLATKFTGLIIIPILVIIVLLKRFYHKNNFNLKKYFKGFLFGLLIAFIIVWLFYGFKIFPIEYIKGFLSVFRHASLGHNSYLLGQISNRGWWYYFPIAIIFKTPIALFVLFLLAIFSTIKTKLSFNEIALLLAAVIYLVISMLTKADLGIRHVLPIFPLLVIFTSKSINLVKIGDVKSKLELKKILVILGFILLILWYFLSSVTAYPNYISYFNKAVGGSQNGYKILADSNLDWGQDLLRIKDYIDKNKITDGFIYYPWDGDNALKYYGINLNIINLQTPLEDIKKLHGKVIISATYYNYYKLDWLQRYPYEQITPGVFIFDIK